MQEVASTARLVDPGAFDAEGGAVIAAVPRSQIETVLREDGAADLVLDVARVRNGDRDDHTVTISWERADLETLLRQASGDQIELTFDQAELERMLEMSDVEAHGLREKALVLTVAAATAAGISGTAARAYAVDPGSQTVTPAGVVQTAPSGLVTDASTSGEPGAVSSLATDASTGGPTAPADTQPGTVSGLVTDASTSGEPGTVSSLATDASTGGPTGPAVEQSGAVSALVTDASTGGETGAVSGLVTDASTSGEPGTVSSLVSDTAADRTRTPAEASGGGGISVSHRAVDAALIGGVALLITGAMFVSRTQRRREQPA